MSFINIPHQTHFIVRGKSKTGSKSYAIPVNKLDLSNLEVHDPENEHIIIQQLNEDSLKISKLDNDPQQHLAESYEKHAKKEIQLWLHYFDEDSQDPRWELCELYIISILNQAYLTSQEYPHDVTFNLNLENEISDKLMIKHQLKDLSKLTDFDPLLKKIKKADEPNNKLAHAFYNNLMFHYMSFIGHQSKHPNAVNELNNVNQTLNPTL